MSEWFKDWFASEDYLNVYSHRNQDDAGSLLKLIHANISLPENALILDSACGSGRHSELLSKLGYNLIAFDLSKTLLQIAQKNKEIHNNKVNYFCSDIRNIPLKASFDLVLNLFTSFGYFQSDEENFAIIDFAGKTVKNGGYFVLDYLNPKYVEMNLIKKSEQIIGSKKIIEERSIKNRRVEKEIEIADDKFRHRYFESVQLYSFQELFFVFKDYGFHAIKEYGNYNGDPYDENSSERMIIIFQKVTE